MRDELVGKDTGVGFDFDEVDGHGRDFCEDDAADGVGEGKVDVREFEVDAEVVVLDAMSVDVPLCRIVAQERRSDGLTSAILT